MTQKVVLIFSTAIYVGHIQTDQDGDIADYDLWVILKNHNDDYTAAQRLYLQDISPSLRAEIKAAAVNSESADVEGWLQIAGAVMLAQAAALINSNGGKLTANLRTTEVLDCQRAVNHICKGLPSDLRPIPMQMDYSRPIRPIAPTAKDPRASNAVPVDSRRFIVTTVEEIQA